MRAVAATLAIVALSGSLAGCGTLVGIEARTEHLVTLRGQLFPAPNSSATIEEVRVCVPDVSPSHCTYTDAFGQFEIRVPGRSMQRVTYSSVDFELQQLLNIGDGDSDSHMAVFRWDEMAGLLDALEVYYEDTPPGIIFIITSNLDSQLAPGLAGYAVSLAPADASVQPLYFVDGLQLSQQETSEAGTGIFLNVPPGDYQLTVHDADKPAAEAAETVRCSAESPTAMGAANTFALVANEGLVTVMLIECEPLMP